MEEQTHAQKWREKMISKHGSWEAVQEFMRQSANKSKRNTGGTGGFKHLKDNNPERLKEISIKAGKASAEKRARQKETNI